MGWREKVKTLKERLIDSELKDVDLIARRVLNGLNISKKTINELSEDFNNDSTLLFDKAAEIWCQLSRKTNFPVSLTPNGPGVFYPELKTIETEGSEISGFTDCLQQYIIENKFPLPILLARIKRTVRAYAYYPVSFDPSNTLFILNFKNLITPVYIIEKITDNVYLAKQLLETFIQQYTLH